MANTSRSIFFLNNNKYCQKNLFSLYYKHSGKFTELRVCQIFSSHIAKVRLILPTSLRHGFESSQEIEFNPTILKTIRFFRIQEKLNTSKIKCFINLIKSLDKNAKQSKTIGYSVKVLEGRKNLSKCTVLFWTGSYN